MLFSDFRTTLVQDHQTKMELAILTKSVGTKTDKMLDLVHRLVTGKTFKVSYLYVSSLFCKLMFFLFHILLQHQGFGVCCVCKYSFHNVRVISGICKVSGNVIFKVLYTKTILKHILYIRKYKYKYGQKANIILFRKCHMITKTILIYL